MPDTEKILVIKLGALGDFIQALGPMAAIRNHHPDAHITLLTTEPYEDIAIRSGYFDEIRLDERPRIFNPAGWLNLRNWLNGAGFTRVYDLQNNDRTCFYFRLFLLQNRPEWVGVAKGASHRNTSPQRTAGHAFDGHVQTLALAGITNVKLDNLAWMDVPLGTFALKKPYVLLVPGSSPSRPEKRWPSASYGRLAKILHGDGYQPVIIGTSHETDIAYEIQEGCSEALDLTGQTGLPEITSLARGASAAIGNDTGPMHLIAATGCPCLVLFSRHSDTVRHRPKGRRVKTLQSDNLSDLSPEKVFRRIALRTTTKAGQSTVH